MKADDFTSDLAYGRKQELDTLAVGVERLDYVATGGDIQEMLLQPEKDVIHLGGNRLGPGFLNLADVISVPLAREGTVKSFASNGIRAVNPYAV